MVPLSGVRSRNGKVCIRPDRENETGQGERVVTWESPPGFFGGVEVGGRICQVSVLCSVQNEKGFSFYFSMFI